MDALQTITSLFGALALLGIMLSGLLLMFAPSLGKQALKNVAVAIALFVLGSMLLQSCCEALR